MIKFKKGHIVPRWIGAIASDRKSQHCIKFGCDVSIENGIIYAESHGYVFYIPDKIKRKMKNKTFKKCFLSVNMIRICSRRVNNGLANAWLLK